MLQTEQPTHHMPSNIRCRTCGHTQAAHETESSTTPLSGYEVSLVACVQNGGYDPKPSEIKDWEKEHVKTHVQ